MSYSDLIFFLGLLPLSILLSFLDTSAEYKNLVLIVTSVIFFSWAKPMVVCLLFVSIIIQYLLGRAIGKNVDNVKGKLFLGLDLLMNAGIFVILGHNYLFEKVELLNISQTLIPIGVGYYCVRGFSYCYDVLKGKCVAEKNIFCLMTYMMSYHFMLVGPVVRYGDIEPAIRKRRVSGKEINDGLVRFIIGLVKVVVVAYVFMKMKKIGLSGGEITLAGCWLGMIGFFAEAYFTFTGLSDMSHGLGKIHGFDYPKNYRDFGVSGLFYGLVKTYNSTLVDFYEEVFTDISKGKKALSVLCVIACSVAVFMWYQIKLNFILVGAIVGLILVLEMFVFSKALKKMPGIFKFIYIAILSILIFGGLYFSSMYGYKKWLLALVGVGTQYELSIAMKYLLINNCFLILVAFISVCPLLKNPLMGAIEKYSDKSVRAYGQVRIFKTVLTCLTFITCVVTLAVRLV